MIVRLPISIKQIKDVPSLKISLRTVPGRLSRPRRRELL